MIHPNIFLLHPNLLLPLLPNTESRGHKLIVNKLTTGKAYIVIFDVAVATSLGPSIMAVDSFKKIQFLVLTSFALYFLGLMGYVGWYWVIDFGSYF